FSVGGCGNDNNSGGPDMSMPDLEPAPDLAIPGISCGTSSCPSTQECCVTVSGTGTTSSTCINAGGTCSGAVLACDGPQQCGSTQFCCGTITFTGGTNPDAGAPMFQGGNASCAATCDASTNYPATPTHVTTRLCHFAADCTGLAIGPLAFDKCCTSAQAPGLHFCGNSLFATCQ
ncbi:MAG TPA: hypothetical protein VF945_08960, partial [Polyangia bacterium]